MIICAVYLRSGAPILYFFNEHLKQIPNFLYSQHENAEQDLGNGNTNGLQRTVSSESTDSGTAFSINKEQVRNEKYRIFTWFPLQAASRVWIEN